MEKRNKINTVFLILMGIIACCKSEENLDWKVEHKIVNYGDEVSLICQVENCCQKSAGWGKWTPDNEFTTIFIDVKIEQKEENSKYYGKTNKMGFILVIRNITRDDLNIDYSCTYGFKISQKKKLLATDVFTESTPGKEKPTAFDSEPRVVMTVLKVAVAIIIVGIAIWFIPLGITYYKNRNVKHKKDSLPPNAEHDNMQPIDGLLSKTEQGKKRPWSPGSPASLPPNAEHDNMQPIDGLLPNTEQGKKCPGSPGSPDFQKGNTCVLRSFSKQSSSNTD